MDPNTNQNMTNTSSSLQLPSQSNISSKTNRKQIVFLMIYSIIITIIAVIILIFLIAKTTSSSEDGEVATETTITLPHENTPMLQLYASLDETMTIDELKKAISDNNSNATLLLYNNGYGKIQSSDSKDSIAFY